MEKYEEEKTKEEVTAGEHSDTSELHQRPEKAEEEGLQAAVLDEEHKGIVSRAYISQDYKMMSLLLECALMVFEILRIAYLIVKFLVSSVYFQFGNSFQ
jgi:hypothetical protein